MIVSGDFVAHGGMDRANLELAKHLAQSGTVDIVSHRIDASLASLPSSRVHLCTRPLGANILGERKLRNSALKVSRTLEEGSRIISNGGISPLPDINWVHYVHAAYKPPFGSVGLRSIKNYLHHERCVRWEKDALQGAKIIVCNSVVTLAHCRDLLGIPADRLRLVYYGVDTDRYKPASAEERNRIRAELGWTNQPTAIFVGGLGDYRKGFDLLYNAWKQLVHRGNWDACLKVVGQGSALEYWRTSAIHDKLTKNIQFLGFRNDVDQLLMASDIMVHPARYEAYGLGVHEAICCGIPAIVSSKAGIAERYPEECRHFLLGDLNSDALLNLLSQWKQSTVSWRDQVAPFGKELRARNWLAMCRDFVTAVSG